MELKERDWLVRVNGIQFSDLDIEFDVKKSLRPEPNACSLVVFGMNRDHRRQIEALNIYDPKKIKGANKTAKIGEVQTKSQIGVGRAPKVGKIRVEIEAGYLEARSLIFRGDLRRGIVHYDGAEVRLEIEGEDGGRSFLQSRINMSFPPGTRQFDVVTQCALAMGLGLGNIREVHELLNGEYTHGTTVSGQASELLSGLLRRARLSYSIQNGVLAFRQNGKGLVTRGLLISQATGMVGRPERDAGGGLMVTTLLIPDVAPGAYVLLDAEDFSGTYFIKSVNSQGQTAGNDWYHVLELFPG